MLNTTRRIDYYTDSNVTAAIMAQAGFSAKAIERRTGLTCGQVHYRNKRLGISLRDYRAGKGWIAEVVEQSVIHADETAEHMKSLIRIKLKELAKGTP